MTRLTSKVCEHCQPLRHETNVLVLARLNVLNRLADINLMLALAAICCFAIKMVLLFIVWPTQPEHLIDGDTFHKYDFGSTFFFSIIEVLILLYSPERRFTNPVLLRFLMFFSVCSTFCALLLIVLNKAAFEVFAHNIDYINDFAIALVDSLLVSTVVRLPAYHPGRDMAARGKLCDNFGKHIAVAATFVPLTLSFGQVIIYNFTGVDARGHLLGERPAHVLEFVFDGVGAAISFWFCLDSKNLVEGLTRQIMIAPDDVVVVIDPDSSTSVHTAEHVGKCSPRHRPGEPPAFFGHGHSHDHGISHSHSHGHMNGSPHDHDGCGGCCEHDHGTPPPLVGRAPNANPLTELLLPPHEKPHDHGH